MASISATHRPVAGPRSVAIGSRQSSFMAPALQKALAGRQASAPRAASRTAGPLSVEANLFSRVTRIFKSYANAAVSAAEDPEKILDQAVTDMQGDLIRLRQAAAEVTASQKKMQNKYDQANSTADDWYRRAELALNKGDEELAKEALTRRKAFADQATMLKQQLDQQGKAVDTIIANMRVLEAKLAEAKMKKDTLKARAQSAKSARYINDVVAGLDTSSALGAFEKMEEKVMALEAQAEAAQMLSAPSDNVESKFRALEGSDVDDDLAKMKAGIGAGSKPMGQLPPGRPISEALDYELQDMKRKMQG